MSEETAEFIDRIAEGVDEIDQDITIVSPTLTKKELNAPSTPVEDRYGRPRWVRTRMCYCRDTRVDSCNIVMRDKCPSEDLDKTQRTAGRWLWASNPDFNTTPVNDEGESAEVENDSGTIVIS